jgi:uncharacterized protein YdeI (YjbR/CyaY-like superfamily)
MKQGDITYFASPGDFRQWFETNHDQAAELWVGFYKKGSGKPSITWPEAVDQALCFGWIDGIRKSVDDSNYTIRFTPRKAQSIWSAINIKKIKELTALGLMKPAGLSVFEKHDEKKANLYSFERESMELGDVYEEIFRENDKAWSFFQTQVPSYKKPAIWWVISAKQEATRLGRLKTLIKDSEEGLKIAHLRR